MSLPRAYVFYCQVPIILTAEHCVIIWIFYKNYFFCRHLIISNNFHKSFMSETFNLVLKSKQTFSSLIKDVCYMFPLPALYRTESKYQTGT